MIDLPPRQRELLDGIITYIEKNQYPPTRREMVAMLGNNSINSITHMLVSLQNKGYIRWEPRMWRALTVLRRPEEGD
jgi:SOS-response transcriptional repressor LexA